MADNEVEVSSNTDAMGIAVVPPRRNEWRRFARVFFGRNLYLI
jgi:hypothetical protein